MSKRDFISLFVKPLAIIFAILIALPAVVVTIYVGTRKEKTAEFSVDGKTAIKLAVYWGLDVYQSVSISVKKFTIAKAEEKILKSSYYAGGPLYFDRLLDVYYLVLNFGVYEIDVKNGFIKNVCFVEKLVLDRLNYVGYFAIREYHRDQDDVAFMLAGQEFPRGFQEEDIRGTINGRCG